VPALAIQILLHGAIKIASERRAAIFFPSGLWVSDGRRLADVGVTG